MVYVKWKEPPKSPPPPRSIKRVREKFKKWKMGQCNEQNISWKIMLSAVKEERTMSKNFIAKHMIVFMLFYVMLRERNKAKEFNTCIIILRIKSRFVTWVMIWYRNLIRVKNLTPESQITSR